jgi:hypothetical protein
MKTVFKVGMKVYDQIYEPDVKGEVLDVNLDISPHPITVKFGSCVRYYTAEGCRGRNQIRTLSTSPYRIEGFEQKSPVPTFEEAWNNWHNSKEIFYSSNCDKVCSGYPTQELADASEALRRLLFLRDYYNNGWQPDWNDVNEKKNVIFSERETFVIREFTIMRCVLAFKSSKIALKFLEEQIELLKIARPLL